MKHARRSVAVLLSSLALILSASAFGQEPEKQEPEKAERKDLVFQGDAKCTRCHDDPEVLDIADARHGGAAKSVAISCTSCHGESDAHIKKPSAAPPDRSFGKSGARTPATQRADACLTCHGTDRHLTFWDSGRHKKNDIACDNCHIIHQPRDVPLRVDNPKISPYENTARQLQYETCTNCHKQIRSQILKTSHHPIIEGKLKCTNCHNPHGALSRAMVNEESVNQLCTSCHADKRGPYLNEHPPVEANCLTCHNSHGSIHPKLLNERAPNLCQDCHDASRHPGTYYSGNLGFGGTASSAPSTRLIARACVNCHTNIHGSNAPASLGKFFLR